MNKLLIILLLIPILTNAECNSVEGCINDFNDLNTEDLVSNQQDCNNSSLIENNSESDQTFSKNFFQRNWPYLLGGVAMTPVAILLGTTIHEGSHALMAKSFGAEIQEFRVIPFTENGSTYMGRMSYTYNGSWTEKQHAFVSAAPMITDTIITGVCSSLAFSGNLPKNRWGKTALNVMCLMPTIDLINHIRATSPSSDLVKLEKRISDGSDLTLTQSRVLTRLPMALTIASGVAASGIMLYDLLRPPVEKSNENRVIHNLRVAPTITGSFNGATLQFEF